MNLMQFSQKVKFVRKRLYLSQQRLADAIGVSKLTIIRWENGTQATNNINAQKFYSFCEQNKINFDDNSYKYERKPTISFARQVVYLRKRLFISRHFLSEKIGVPYQTIWRWEIGKAKPSPQNMQKFYEFCRKKCVTFP